MHDVFTKIAALEREWMDAWKSKNMVACDVLLAEDFVLVSATGRLMSKGEWLLAASDSFVCEDFQWQDIRVRPFGRFAIVHARVKQKAAISGKDWSGVFLLTDVWVQRSDEWQVVSRHGSGPIHEPERGV